MPRYDAQRIEPKWQAYWDEHETFKTPDGTASGPKFYALDMFPYPSGSGLHVGHPEGYTATDIISRYKRMNGVNVMHPMGWDAFGLPAEQYAIETGTHPRVTTYKNIDTFRRQLKMLGFSYDWSREVATTDIEYVRWTQWIFLQLFKTWYDPDFEWTGPDGKPRVGKGRPIADLPIPDDVTEQGSDAVRKYQDEHRLAYQSEAPVNWCPALGTVLANEEVTADGKSDRGNHPVERRALRQWMLRITSYAERLISELDDVDWPESVKLLQRNWIGKSVGAEVDFYIGDQFVDWKQARTRSGFPRSQADDVLRVYTTRPDTLFGATYMVIAPEHPYVKRLTTPEHKQDVEEYCRTASLKSDLDRTDLAKGKSGVFTGSYAINPVNGEQIPIWIADYVLISYGTGAIMAVPAHDQRDMEFAVKYDIPVRGVVRPVTGQNTSLYEQYADEYLDLICEYIGGQKYSGILHCWLDGNTSEAELRAQFASSAELSRLVELRKAKQGLFLLVQAPFFATLQIQVGGTVHNYPLREAIVESGKAVNSDDYNGLPTAEFKQQITADLEAAGLGRAAVNYRLRDWLFSRQRYWGEPFPIWHELDDKGNLTGRLRAVSEDELPVELPDMDDFKPRGTPEPPLSFAPESWLYQTAEDGTRLKRETNSMPQWAGSCWYYLRFCDPRNNEKFIDPEVEKYWLPVDLYIGGVEHAVLHLLYARFWHKVLFDLGHLSNAEPFRRLVNQGMILGEPFYVLDGDFPDEIVVDPQNITTRQGKQFATHEGQEFPVIARAEKMSKSRGNVITPDDIVHEYGADSLRLYEMFMGPLEQTKPWSMSGVEGVFRFLARVWRMITDDKSDDIKLHPAVTETEPTDDQLRILHKTIKSVTEGIEKLSFNTAISRMMEFTNELSGQDVRPRSVMEPFVLLLSPFAPHLAEELWQLLGHKKTLAYEPWPKHDESKLIESEIEIPVQIKGKVRGRVMIPADADQETMISLAQEAVADHLAGKDLIKTIAVPGKMVNFVVKG